MNIDKLISELVIHEGFKLKPYVDTVGKITIGVGHNLTDNGLTKDQVFKILRDDINDTMTFLNMHCPWWNDLDDVRQRAIADMTFDLEGRLLNFVKMINAIKAKDWDTASDELLHSTFATQTGQRAKDLAYMLKTGKDV